MNVGKPQKQAIAIAYNVKKAEGGPIMSDDRMMSSLMKRRKLKQGFDLDQDEMPRQHERPDDAKMNNQKPDLREQSRELGDGGDFDHKLSAEGSPAQRESALYADGGSIDPDKAQSAQDSMRKAFKYARGGDIAYSDMPEHDQEDLKQGHDESTSYASGGKVTSGPHSDRQIAYGQGRSESEQQDEPRLSDEDSRIAMAEGGIAYNSNLKEDDQDDTPKLSDENSHIAYAKGGDIAYTDQDEHDQSDTAQSHDEDSSYAQGGSVDSQSGEHDLDDERHLKPDYADTKESKDEASSVAYAGGGQIDDDQNPSRNPKSFQDEDEQEQAMKARRRKLMISVLND